jgi:hypothetical protein
MRPRLLAAAVTMAVTAGLAAACDTMAPGQALPDMTMWQLIQRSDNPDGTTSLQASLVKFSYLFGPLPGVTMPLAKPDPPGFRVSGSSAISAMIHHWSELTVEQRETVAKVVTPSEPLRMRAKPDPVKDSARPVIQAEVNNFIQAYGTRTGTTVGEVKFDLVDKDEPPSRAWSLPLAAGEEVQSDTHQKSIKNGPAERCVMFFPPSVWRNVAGGVPAPLRVTIGHEIFHCVQAFGFPDLIQYHALASWIGDGVSEFAATDVVGAANRNPNTWTNYLTIDASLFDRADTAMGWWFHLQHLGHDPYKRLPPQWKQGQVGRENFYLAMGGHEDDVYDTWAASRLRAPSMGDAWEVHGTDVPPDKPAVIEARGENGSIDVEAFDARPAKLTWADDTAGVLRVSAANPVRLRDDGGLENPHTTAGDYCLGLACTCPDDTERKGEEIQRIQGPLWLGVAGGEAGNSVLTDVVTLEDYCKKKQPDRKKPKARPRPKWAPAHAPGRNPNGPKGDGSGQTGDRPKPASTGDPHLTSLDGHNFDFQASGEFTLIRSDSGDLEVQTRQQPRVKFDGKESDIASMNTAVAANVGGDRVGFYADQDRPRVHVNGTPVSGGQSLPKGGKITAIEAGYSVRWPDGTEMWVVNAGAPDSLTVLFGPSEARAGELHGLIGPFDATAMFDRDGHRYDKPDFDQLYKKIGDSWRIRQSDSLFDYQDGASTATFTRRDLPAKPLTLADLSPEQRKLGETACAGVPVELRERCVFDVAVSGEEKFAVGYRTLDKLTSVGGGGLRLGEKAGPRRLEPGQQQTFTIDSDADTLYFASDADCTKPTSATVYWRITMPDGHDTLQVPMCADAGRQTTTKHGTWKIDVWVAPGADQGGIFALHVAAAGQQRKFDISLPKTVDDGSLAGAGAEDRHVFTAAAGDKVTLTSKSTCDSDRPLYWGLESPDGNRVTLRTKVCDNIGQQTIPTAGKWAVAIYNSTADETRHSYGFTVSRS